MLDIIAQYSYLRYKYFSSDSKLLSVKYTGPVVNMHRSSCQQVYIYIL